MSLYGKCSLCGESLPPPSAAAHSCWSSGVTTGGELGSPFPTWYVEMQNNEPPLTEARVREIVREEIREAVKVQYK